MTLTKSHYARKNKTLFGQLGRWNEGIQRTFSSNGEFRYRWYTRCTGTAINFGLLPPETGKEKSLELLLDLDHNNKLKIKLLECRAVTLGGARIELNQSNEQLSDKQISLEIDFDFSSVRNQELDIILVVNPFSRTPMGLPNPDESPPRHPFSMPQYLIELVPSEQIKRSEFGRYHLPLGRLEVKIGEVKFAEYYIPPCTSVKAHPQLLDYYRQYDDSLKELLSYTLQIIRKIKARSERTSLAENMQLLTEQMAFCLTDVLNDFYLYVPHQSPIYMVGHFTRLARIMRTALRCMPEEEREQLLMYLSEWTTQTPGEFEAQIERIIHLEYNHYDINDNLEPINRFNEMLFVIFDKIRQLDFIGHKKQLYTPPPPKPEPKEELPKTIFKISKDGRTIREKKL